MDETIAEMFLYDKYPVADNIITANNISNPIFIWTGLLRIGFLRGLIIFKAIKIYCQL